MFTEAEKLQRKREGQRLYRLNNRDKLRVAQQKYRACNVDKINNKRFQIEYGITLEDRNTMFEKQGRVCAICGTDKPGKVDWRVDHCHITKVFRGVLCHSCNVALGHFRDSISILKRAIEYLSERA